MWETIRSSLHLFDSNQAQVEDARGVVDTVHVRDVAKFLKIAAIDALGTIGTNWQVWIQKEKNKKEG